MQVEKPKEPTGTPQVEVQEAKKPESDSSKEVRSDDAKTAMESELGRLRQELGDARKEAETNKPYRLWYDQYARQQTVPQQQQEKPNYDDQWLDKPTETYEKLSQQREMRLMYQTAFQQAPLAKAMAKMQHPDAFEGITDAELEQAMYGGVQSGTTNPNILSDPNAWVGAAWILRGPKSGFKFPTAPPKGMSPQESEKPGKPSASGDDDETPELKGDDLTKELIKRAVKEGVKEEDFIKKVHENRGRGAR